MAEYIDREQVFPYCSYEGDCMGTGADCIKCPDNVIDYQDFMNIPAADVVGQRKIDKAIEEGYKIRKSILQSNDNYTANDVLDIIDEILEPFKELYEGQEGNK